MPAKKHPLEIFRKHGATFGTLSGKEGPKRTAAVQEGKRAPSGKGGAGPRTPARTGGGRGGDRKARFGGAPGEWRISLSLNLVLVLLLLTVGLSLFTYFLGYHKGLGEGKGIGVVAEGGPAAPLKEAVSGRYLSPEGNVSQPPLEKEVSSTTGGSAQTFYGVQVGVWSRKKRALAEEAARWLTGRYGKKGVIFKVSPLADSDFVTIIAGSFTSGEDPELARLLEAIRGVNDYPSGGAAPFRSAKIVSYSLAKGGS